MRLSRNLERKCPFFLNSKFHKIWTLFKGFFPHSIINVLEHGSLYKEPFCSIAQNLRQLERLKKNPNSWFNFNENDTLESWFSVTFDLACWLAEFLEKGSEGWEGGAVAEYEPSEKVRSSWTSSAHCHGLPYRSCNEGKFERWE